MNRARAQLALNKFHTGLTLDDVLLAGMELASLVREELENEREGDR